MRSTRNQPFCWQEKKILRLFKNNFEGAELSKYICLYTGITWLDSDFNGQDIKWYSVTLANRTGLNKDWVSKSLKILVKLGIIEINTTRNEKGRFEGTSLTFTPENVSEDIIIKDEVIEFENNENSTKSNAQSNPKKTVIGETNNRLSGAIEDSILLEDISLLEDNTKNTCNMSFEKNDLGINPKGFPRKDKWEKFLNENLKGIDYIPEIENSIKLMEKSLIKKGVTNYDEEIENYLIENYNNTIKNNLNIAVLVTAIIKNKRIPEVVQKGKKEKEKKPVIKKENEKIEIPVITEKEKNNSHDNNEIVITAELEKKAIEILINQKGLTINNIQEAKRKGTKLYNCMLKEALKEVI